ncbi:hypothetical protein AWB81_06113 [Caballeronia arationis]|uniref:Uncharacterized protein n=1 Tax=Caballeronia arationis TaxID=1777142 RepID=A0A7Z7IH96_9BURK|nr:hypothetical protein [Caballeronia arationis]SAL01814.1 hypothetical protein AWB81_06113 [Caballeronia arationis]SOE89424.1 hypothetical protein SAMN05446927_7996 [Caballeronia arationis]
MTCLSERIVGAIFCMLSGYSFAESLVIDSPETMMVANIAPPPELIPPIPEPQRYLHSYEMEYRSNQGKSSYAQMADFYSAQVTHDFQFGAGNTTPTPEPVLQQASNFLRPGPSTAPQISIVQLPNTVLTLRAQPQRRLSLTVDDWVFSATARLAILRAHDTGATVSVRHGF